MAEVQAPHVMPSTLRVVVAMCAVSPVAAGLLEDVDAMAEREARLG